MQMQDAPYHHDVADGPPAQAAWIHAQDGVRLRIAHWPHKKAQGTVLLMPGRTEYIEKYGRAAGEFASRGYAMVTIDWRGQGLADRLIDDPMSGYVNRFSDYQLDVAALLEAAVELDLPKPWYVVAHSMGGCIGMRALYDNLPVNAAVFSGPMWGIQIAPTHRPFAWALGWASSRIGKGGSYAPGTNATMYVMEQAFDGNALTTDAQMYSYMQAQLTAFPELALGGPSLHWLYEALVECRALARKSSPEMPCLTFMGENEQIVQQSAIFSRMNAWPNGRLELVPNGEHEILMEAPQERAKVFDACAQFFAEHR